MSLWLVALADDERTERIESRYLSQAITRDGLPAGVADNLRDFIRNHHLSTKPKSRDRFQRKSSRQQTVIHVLPLVIRPGVFPQGFFRITNAGSSDETIEILLANDAGRAGWVVEVDTRGGETRHVNSDDLAGWTDKAGIRSSQLGIDLSDETTYAAVTETSTNIHIRAFSRSSDGFINDLATAQIPFRTDSDDWSTILGTANPGSNRSVVGVLRYLNLDRVSSEAVLDIWGYDDNGTRSGTATCAIPRRGTLTIETSELEQGTHSSCSGSWGDGVGKWEVHTQSESLHMAMSFMFSEELGILANVSTAEIYRLERDASTTQE